jgi:hypothetical protein
MSWNQHAEKNHNIKTGNTSSERAEQLRYLRTNLTDQIPFVKKLRADRGLGMLAITRCSILSSTLLSKNTQNCNFVCFVWVWSWVCHTEGRTCKLRVFQNRLAREWRIHNEELYNLCSPPNIIWVIKSRRMRSVGHVACIQDWGCDGKRSLLKT